LLLIKNNKQNSSFLIVFGWKGARKRAPFLNNKILMIFFLIFLLVSILFVSLQKILALVQTIKDSILDDM